MSTRGKLIGPGGVNVVLVGDNFPELGTDSKR